MTDLRDPADGTPTSPDGAPPAPDPRAMPPWLPRAIGLFLLGVAWLFVVWWLLQRLRTLSFSCWCRCSWPSPSSRR
jgi:hypothetical protein